MLQVLGSGLRRRDTVKGGGRRHKPPPLRSLGLGLRRSTRPGKTSRKEAFQQRKPSGPVGLPVELVWQRPSARPRPRDGNLKAAPPVEGRQA